MKDGRPERRGRRGQLANWDGGVSGLEHPHPGVVNSQAGNGATRYEKVPPDCSGLFDLLRDISRERTNLF